MRSKYLHILELCREIVPLETRDIQALRPFWIRTETRYNRPDLTRQSPSRILRVLHLIFKHMIQLKTKE
jgi:hypothetical protein